MNKDISYFGLIFRNVIICFNFSDEMLNFVAKFSDEANGLHMSYNSITKGVCVSYSIEMKMVRKYLNNLIGSWINVSSLEKYVCNANIDCR